MQTTENYNLKVAELTDVADIENSVSVNFPIIDTALHNHDTALNKLKNKGNVTTPVYIDANGNAQTTKNFDDYLPLSGGTLSGQITINSGVVCMQGIVPALSVYRDVVQGVNGATNKRIGVVRMQKFDTENAVVIGACDGLDSAPSGLIVHRSLGDENTPGEVWVTVSASPLTNDASTKVATTNYVKSCVPKNIGSATKPTYTNNNGVVTECTYSLGANVPGNAKFTDSMPTVTTSGTGNAVTGISIVDDLITAVKGETFVKSGDTVVAKKGTSTQPVYMSANNVATACTMLSASATGIATVTAQTLSATSGYIRLNNGLTINWGQKTSGTFTFKKAFTTVYGAWAINTTNDWCRINSLSNTMVETSNANGYVLAIGVS